MFLSEDRIEGILTDRYAEFMRHGTPDSLAYGVVDDVVYLKAIREAEEQETIRLSTAISTDGNPEKVLEKVFAEYGKILQVGEEDGERQVAGLFLHRTDRPQAYRKKHPPVLCLCWFSGYNICVILCAKNPPENPDAAAEACTVFEEAVNKYNRMINHGEEVEISGQRKHRTGLIHKLRELRRTDRNEDWE